MEYNHLNQPHAIILSKQNHFCINLYVEILANLIIVDEIMNAMSATIFNN